jgi:hypothetical protein
MSYAAFRNRPAPLTRPVVGGMAQLMAATIPAARGPSPL